MCRAIYFVFAPKYMKVPDTGREWLTLVNETSQRWQFPNCFADVDGKHVGVLCPPHSESDYYNYKAFFSIVLMALRLSLPYFRSRVS